MTYAALAHFGDYAPADFGWGARDPEANPSLLVPFSHSGVSFGSMHRDAVGLFTALLDELVPLIPGGLVAGQCGCFNPNSVTENGSRSFHTYGIAIDLNWDSNPMGTNAIRADNAFRLPDATSTIAREYGCEWGGNWIDFKDWMHIEVHLPPDAARTVQPIKPPTTHTEDDDEMLYFTVTTHPTTHQKRGWVIGPAGVTEAASEAACRHAAAIAGRPVAEVSEALMVDGRSALQKAIA